MSAPAASSAPAGGADAVMFYPAEEIASLVRSLNRKSDKQLFSEDVLVTYPHLTAAYTKVCPQRCDLATAARNALQGRYSYEPDLATLRADVQLMVSNCIRFNGDDSPLAATAADFERFALEKIRGYIDGKTGGRRTSSLRFLQKATAPPASATRAEAGGRAKEAARAEEVFPVKEVVQLVSSLVRREDAGAFSVDVAERYPELRDAYLEACPQPMNLARMRERAESREYHSGSAPVIGASVADCLPLLRGDVELVVGNCIRFNAQVKEWVDLARSFQAFAHRRIDDFVLRKLPHLRGTPTGAGRYAGSSSEAKEAAAAAAPAVDDAAPARKRGREGALAEAEEPTPSATTGSRGAGRAAAETPRVQVVATVAANVKPTALQPPLSVPARLRRRLVEDYTQRDTVGLRAVGGIFPVAAVLSDADESAPAAAPAAAAPTATLAEAQPGSPSPPTMTITSEMSAAALLNRFEAAVSAFYAHQRTRDDFTDAFQFSRQEEATYGRVLRVIAEQFEQLLPSLLLYEKETVELRRLAGQRALHQALAADQGSSGAGAAAWRWADKVHYVYLVRLLVQFPQIASLAAAKTAPSGAAAAAARITISQDAVAVVQYITKVTQELLNFVADYDSVVAKEAAAAATAEAKE